MEDKRAIYFVWYYILKVSNKIKKTGIESLIRYFVYAGLRISDSIK